MRTRHEVGANQHTALQPGCSVSARAGREQQHAPPPHGHAVAPPAARCSLQVALVRREGCRARGARQRT